MVDGQNIKKERKKNIESHEIIYIAMVQRSNKTKKIMVMCGAFVKAVIN